MKFTFEMFEQLTYGQVKIFLEDRERISRRLEIAEKALEVVVKQYSGDAKVDAAIMQDICQSALAKIREAGK